MMDISLHINVYYTSKMGFFFISYQKTSINLFFLFLLQRQRVQQMFYHAYDSYLKYAYPYDELRPLTCDGYDTWGR